jgi:DNA-binding CsgD family transcriptional regulator
MPKASGERDSADRRNDGGTVAWIELGVHAGTRRLAAPGLDDLALDHARRQIERAVRGGDRVCPVSTASVVVEFGPVASGVAPRVLGDRLARAVGPSLPFDRLDSSLTVAVGMAAPLADDPPWAVAHRARSAARSSVRSLVRMRPGRPASRAVVTVDEPVRAPSGGSPARPAAGPHRRSVHRYGAGPVAGATFTDCDHDADAAGPEARRSSSMCVLVVDPMASPADSPGFAARTAVSIAEHLGCRTTTTVVSPDEPPVMTIGGEDIDLVVLVLDGTWVGRSPDWASGAWGLPARLTGVYTDKGTPVLAVSAGAGAGAVASCVAGGALALFSLDRLAEALLSLDAFSVDDARQIAELGFPERFRQMLGLTAGERRVLFYMTQGWAAQDIADELVVSLTTVRSHIRSVLRKLGVRSQLAAVAVANSRDLEHPPAPAVP